MAQLDVTNFQAALKLLYPRGLGVLYPKCPSWLDAKRTDFTAKHRCDPDDERRARQHDVNNAVNSKALPLNRFLVTRAKDYALKHRRRSLDGFC